jgi:hypothetical protein
MFMVMVVIMFVVMAIVVMVMMVMIVVVMVVMIVLMVVVVVRDFLLAVDADSEVRRGDAAAGDRLADEFDARDVKGVQFVECGLRVGLEFEKCGREHVARGAH